MLVSITRVLNEDDIIEAFVRHNATYVDRMLLLDNGSTDRTEEILRALHAEGYPITLLRAQSVHFNEVAYNTVLFHAAVTSYSPDWVLYLDADEFLDTRRLGQTLPARLATVPPDIAVLKLPLVNYFTNIQTAEDLLIPRRFTLRDTVDYGVVKCIVRGNVVGQDPVIDAGNHDVWLNGSPASYEQTTDLRLAHYAVRHPMQWVAKAALGRLKVLATGSDAEQRQWSGHYTPMLDLLRTNPSRLRTEPVFTTMPPPGLSLAEDPITYAGLPLRHTQPVDPVMKAIQTLATGAERLARNHGRLLDSDPELRKRAHDWAMEMQLLF